MKLIDLFEANLFDSSRDEAVLNDLDHFLASPNHTLKSKTVAFLKGRQKTSLKLFRVLSDDDLSTLSKRLEATDLKVGVKVKHTSPRATSWTTSLKAIDVILAQADEWGGSEHNVVISTTIPAEHILLDTTKLSTADLAVLRDNSPELLRTLRQQQEVIVDAGTYEAVVVRV
jgi:hypothetical protein